MTIQPDPNHAGVCKICGNPLSSKGEAYSPRLFECLSCPVLVFDLTEQEQQQAVVVSNG